MLRTPVGQASGRRNEQHQGNQEEKMAKRALKGGVKTPHLTCESGLITSDVYLRLYKI
jgi:hypothetical protein